MGGGHGGTGDGVGSVLATNPGGENVKTRGKDVIALAVVGEVGTFIGKVEAPTVTAFSAAAGE